MAKKKGKPLIDVFHGEGKDEVHLRTMSWGELEQAMREEQEKRIQVIHQLEDELQKATQQLNDRELLLDKLRQDVGQNQNKLDRMESQNIQRINQLQEKHRKDIRELGESWRRVVTNLRTKSKSKEARLVRAMNALDAGLREAWGERDRLRMEIQNTMGRCELVTKLLVAVVVTGIPLLAFMVWRWVR